MIVFSTTVQLLLNKMSTATKTLRSMQTQNDTLVFQFGYNVAVALTFKRKLQLHSPVLTQHTVRI